MKIVFLDAATVGDLEELNQFKLLGDFIAYPTTSAKEVFSRVEGADVIITNKVLIDRGVMDKAASLKLICVAATGTNNIDLGSAEEKGILVKNVKGYSTESVVQQTFTLLFALMNHVEYYGQFVRSGRYSESPTFTDLSKPFNELSGKTFGIIGLGTIGRRVALVAEAFGAKVIYYSTSGKNLDSYFQSVSLDQLLTSSDVISIHAPLNDATKNIISDKELAKMKASALIINTGRGGIIDEAALVEALDKNLIAGAALDVFTQEPLPKDNPIISKLQNKDKLILSPHIAWASLEARRRLLKGVFKNIEAFVSDK